MSAPALKTSTRLPALPARARDGNKGDYGKIVVLGGSRGMAGAPCLAARAAYRSGAGLVRVVVPEGIWDTVAGKLDECVTAGLPQTAAGSFSRTAAEAMLEHLDWADVLVAGPGLAQHGDSQHFARTVLATCVKPAVVDADGLNAFVGRTRDFKAKAPRVLTPHPGEMARLLGRTVAAVQADRVAAVRACAEQTGAVVVLKGAGTLVCDGKRCYHNATGNPGMASGGTGDVLAGMIGALLGQGMKAFDAACLGVHLHGAAGDRVAAEKGEWSLIASDLIVALPRVFVDYAQKKTATGKSR